MSHSTINKPLVVYKGAVKTDGGAANLAKGQLAFVLDKATAEGAKVVSNFAPLKSSERVAIRLGRNKLPNNLRDKHAPYFQTDYFRLDSIVNITANAPKVSELKFDEFLIGYDGINADTALFIPEGKSAKIDIVLHGYPVEAEFGEEMHIVEMRASRKEGQTMQEVIIKLVEELNDYLVPRSRKKLSDYVDIKVVDSTNDPLTGTEWVISTLEVDDEGSSNDLAAVQAQYTGYNVVRTERNGLTSTYAILHLVADALADYESKDVASYVKDCETCKAGYTASADGETCLKTVEDTIEWVDGDSCFAKTKTYTIQLKDDNCGESRLAELQDYYPQLTITETATAGGCQRVYSTTVPTNIVCDECDDIFLQPFCADAPEPYNETYWKADQVAYSDDALMGIVVKGKPYLLYPEDYAKDQIPFIETSTKIRSASFGVREMDYLNFTPAYDVDTEFAQVIQLSHSEDRQNLSHVFFGYEEMSRVHFLGEHRHKDNLFARVNLGEESLLDYNSRLVTYHISYQDTRLSQSAGGRSNITHEIVLVVEEGYQAEIQTIVNNLATKVGLPVVAPIV
jgi:hypothetical protein